MASRDYTRVIYKVVGLGVPSRGTSEDPCIAWAQLADVRIASTRAIFPSFGSSLCHSCRVHAICVVIHVCIHTHMSMHIQSHEHTHIHICTYIHMRADKKPTERERNPLGAVINNPQVDPFRIPSRAVMVNWTVSVWLSECGKMHYIEPLRSQ